MQLLWKTLSRFLKKLKTELQYDPAIPLLKTYPQEKKKKTTLFIVALFQTAKIRNLPKFTPTDKWLKKISYIHPPENYFML